MPSGQNCTEKQTSEVVVGGGVELNETKRRPRRLDIGLDLQSKKLIMEQSAQRWRCQSLISKSTAHDASSSTSRWFCPPRG
jgi:hypothetical protein